MSDQPTAGPYNILFPYAGDRFGGSNVSSLVMACGLRERGHKITVVTHGPGRAHNEAAMRGFATLMLPPLSRHPGYSRPDRFRVDHLAAFGPARAMIKANAIDIVHTNDLAMLRTWALPAATTQASLFAHWRAASQAGASVQAAMYLAEKVISVSQYSKDILPGWVQRKCIVEFNALEEFYADEARQAARKRIRELLGCPAEAALIGVFGNLTRRKRAHVIVDILAGIGETVAGRPLLGLVCGAPAEPRDEKIDGKIEAHGLQSRIFRPGFVRPALDWMAACDVIIAPAVKEPLARNVLEAMAVGIPVVTSDDGGLREFIVSGTEGYVLAPNDIEGWTNCCRTLLKDPALAQRIGCDGQAKARSLSILEHAKRIEAIYATMHNKKRGIADFPSDLG